MEITPTTVAGALLARALINDLVRPSTKVLGRRLAQRVRALVDDAAPSVASAERMLSDANLQPRPVEPRRLIPLLEGASLESDEGLQERWAALLANALSGDRGAPVLPSFSFFLQQLSSLDVLVLSSLHKLGAVAPEGGVSRTILRPESSGATKTSEWGVSRDAIQAELEVSPEEALGVSLDTLVGLGLVEPEPRVREDLTVSDGQGVRLTRLGWRFIAACNPPSRERSDAGDLTSGL